MERNRRKAKLIDTVVDLVRARQGDGEADLAGEFIRQFYAAVPPEDLIGHDPDYLYGAALSFLAFARNRSSGAPKIRVFNPTLSEHGWKCGHTVIEVVHDDLPFLVDSTRIALINRDLIVHLIIHPTLRTVRDGGGRLERLMGRGEDEVSGERREACIQILIDEHSDPNFLDAVAHDIGRHLADVRISVQDWPDLRGRMAQALDELQTVPDTVPERERVEATAFLRWLLEDHYTFLGYRAYALEDQAGQEPAVLVPRKDSGLGVLRDPGLSVFYNHGRPEHELPPDVREFMADPMPLKVTKANQRATVHRRVHMDTVTVATYDAQGRVTGEHLFAGLFTASAYTRSPTDIPLLREKVHACLDRAGLLGVDSHDTKQMLHILETFPRDELFQIDQEPLFETVMGILNLQQRQRIKLFARVDRFQRFVSALVYIPREHYNTDLRVRLGEILANAYGGQVSAFYPWLAEGSPLARVQFVLRTTPGKVPPVNLEELERELVDAARSWISHLGDALFEEYGEERANALLRRYRQAFPTAYRERFSAGSAVLDIGHIEAVRRGEEVSMDLYRPLEAPEGQLRLKIYLRGQTVPLSQVLPMLENMGAVVLDEIPYDIAIDDTVVRIHDIGLRVPAVPDDLSRYKARFHDALTAVWTGEAENDGFNRLVLAAGLGWREVEVLRAYSRYLRQAGVRHSLVYMQDTLLAHAHIASDLVMLFRIRFDPEGPADPDDRERRAQAVLDRIATALDAVESLDQDRILRRYLNLVQATLRTNWYRVDGDGRPRSHLALKLASTRIDDLPLPRPWVEVFVSSPRMQGIHLRGGKVARGGIRWSDRPEDFRTEVLGLMKAQMVKNAVIVPVGAKGGFVCRRLPVDGGREAVMAEVVACYQTLVRALLDVTDNRVGDEVMPPERVVRHDEDDPYLVVAPDKGTATFSDIANEISAEYGFWLGDAFASGGSAGYDHKAMGITARGAWVAVERHFRELGHDTRSQPFDVIGVGDMSGDVFGNGMLLSDQIRLIGAFNHLHIFLDPDPDPATSFAERQRLFALPRSSWSDYDPEKISAGGGVFPRSAKWVDLSPEVRSRLGLAQQRVRPNELIRALLGAPADLLWFGGIGTYVKGPEETDAEVGDRTNDAIRLDGDRLQVRVVGEGANLAMTQLGRIAFARTGGKVNTDFIDNSGGVDCSDHEVNIKILLDEVVEAQDLTLKQRNDFMATMTDEVADLVLRHNHRQTQAITVAEAGGLSSLDAYGRMMRWLERTGHLNRAVEFLPDEEALAERAAAGQGLTRPEIAVLLAVAKIALNEALLASDLPDSDYFSIELNDYFPQPLRDRFHRRICRHRLRRELVATRLTDTLINRGGPRFVHRMQSTTGAPAVEIARAFTVTREVFELRSLWRDVEALDYQVPADLQSAILRDSTLLLTRISEWFLRHETPPLDIRAAVDGYRPGITALRDALPQIVTESERQRVNEHLSALAGHGVPDGVARRAAALRLMGSACDIVHIARKAEADVRRVGRLYFAVGERFAFDWARSQAEALGTEGGWDRRAADAVTDDLFHVQQALTGQILADGGNTATVSLLANWCDGRGPALARVDDRLTELRAAGQVSLAMLIVAVRELRDLVAR